MPKFDSVPGLRWGQILLVTALFAGSTWGAPAVEEERSAGPSLEECRRAFVSAPSDEASARCFRNATTPQNRQAVVEQVNALIRSHSEEPWLYYHLSGIEWTTESPKVLLELLARAADLLHRQGDLDGEIRAERGIINLLLDLDRSEDASAELERLKLLVNESSKPIHRAWVHLTEVRYLIAVEGALDSALALLASDETFVRDSGRAPDELKALWLRFAFISTYELGRYDEAGPLLEELAEWAESSTDGHLKASVALFETVFEAATRLPSAEVREFTRGQAVRSLDLARASGDLNLQVRSLTILGRLEKGAEGRTLLEECLTLTTDSPDRWSLHIECLSALAEQTAGDGDHDARRVLEELLETRRQLEAAVGEARQDVPRSDGWAGLTLDRAIARLHWRLGEREQGWQAGWTVLDRLETLRQAQVDKGGRVGVVAARWEPYLWLAGTLLSASPKPTREYLERSFQVTERMRGRVLLEVVEGKAHKGLRETASLGRVEKALDEHAALLSFQFSADEDIYGRSVGGSWVTVATRQGSRAIPLQDRVVVEPLIRTLAGLQELEAAPELLQRFYGLVLEEAIAGLPSEVEHLILIPDGELHRIPFEALRSSADPATSVANRFRISYQPSATLWLKWRSLPTGEPAPSSALVLADPLLAAAAAHPRATGLRGQAKCEDLSPLPSARQEGRDVLERLGGGRLLVGDEASESALMAEPLEEYSLIHFAAHACSVPSRPESSAILLAPGDGAHDGWLRPSDILRLEALPPVVVLAACRTADGRVIRGEGVMSLARPFFEAGARVVVASQRDLPDHEASLMFAEVYRHLSEGRSIGDSFHRMQRERIREGAPAAGWASLRVLGDADWVPFPGGVSGRKGARRGLTVGLLLAGGFGGVLAIWAVRRRRRGPQ